jgi:hypothetical protein
MDTSRLVAALAHAYGQILPSTGFKVESNGDRLSVTAVAPSRHAGSVYTGPGVLTLLLPMPKAHRLRVFFENEARSLQEFVCETEHKDWPAPNASPHVVVTADEVRVWYGDQNESSAALHWPSFHRAALGI